MNKTMHNRIRIGFFALTVFFGILIADIFLIIVNIDSLPSSNTGNTRSIVLSESRGMIYDCNMKKMVNSSSETVTALLPTLQALNSVSPFISQSVQEEITDNIATQKTSVVYTDEFFSENDIKSVSAVKRYSKHQSCVHLIGHLDESGDGAMGLEKAYNSYLSQQKGSLKAVWSVNALGKILYGNGITVKSTNYLSPAGIQLTIDSEVQNIIENTLEEHNITCGASVVIDADTCEILGCASVPTFDPNNPAAALNGSNSPFLNRAISAYSVGSVFKPFVAACAIEKNVEITHECTGKINVGSTAFKCYNDTAHGKVTLKTAMEKSCNAFFISLGQKVGADSILTLCKSLGFGEKTELADNFYLKSGYLPSSDEISSLQDLANLSFGQGKLMASPIQMALAYACFANGGYYRPPTLMKSIIDRDGNVIQGVILPEKIRVLNTSTVNQIDKVLRSVVTDGNGNKAFSPYTDGRGKTATAQSGWYKDGEEISHTWFCGYFTVNGRKYVAVIFKESGNSGAVDCAPAFKDISEKITLANLKNN